VSLDRLDEIRAFMNYHHRFAMQASDNAGEYTAISPDVCGTGVVGR
jgi:hypothetical protein